MTQSTLIVVVVLVLLFGGGGWYLGDTRYEGRGPYGFLFTVLIVLLFLWVFGIIRLPIR